MQLSEIIENLLHINKYKKDWQVGPLRDELLRMSEELEKVARNVVP